MHREEKLSFFERCVMVTATPSKMLGALIRDNIKVGSELIPLDIGFEGILGGRA